MILETSVILINKFPFKANSWLTVLFGAVLRNENKELSKISEQFTSFLRLVFENIASLVHLLSTVCEMKGFEFFSIL